MFTVLAYGYIYLFLEGCSVSQTKQIWTVVSQYLDSRLPEKLIIRNMVLTHFLKMMVGKTVDAAGAIFQINCKTVVLIAIRYYIMTIPGSCCKYYLCFLR